MAVSTLRGGLVGQEEQWTGSLSRLPDVSHAISVHVNFPMCKRARTVSAMLLSGTSQLPPIEHLQYARHHTRKFTCIYHVDSQGQVVIISL